MIVTNRLSTLYQMSRFQTLLSILITYKVTFTVTPIIKGVRIDANEKDIKGDVYDLLIDERFC